VSNKRGYKMAGVGVIWVGEIYFGVGISTYSAIRMMKPYGGQHRGIWNASKAHPIRAAAPLWCKPFLYTNQSRAQFDPNLAQI
jgi:hypothetical protein